MIATRFAAWLLFGMSLLITSCLAYYAYIYGPYSAFHALTEGFPPMLRFTAMVQIATLPVVTVVLYILARRQ